MNLALIENDLPLKLDNDMSNFVPSSTYVKLATNNRNYMIKETYVNGTSGYRIWTDGYCEQWGVGDHGSFERYWTCYVGLMKKYNGTNYQVLTSTREGNANTDYCLARGGIVPQNVWTYGIQFYVYGYVTDDEQRYFSWLTMGYLDSGAY